MTPIEVINELNQNNFNSSGLDIVPFTYETDGYIEIIKFMEWPLWSSEADGYEWEDEDGNTQVPLMNTVKDLFADHLTLLKSMTLESIFPEEKI